MTIAVLVYFYVFTLVSFGFLFLVWDFGDCSLLYCDVTCQEYRSVDVLDPPNANGGGFGAARREGGVNCKPNKSISHDSMLC